MNKLGTLAVLITLLGTVGAVSATSYSFRVSVSPTSPVFQGGAAATNPVGVSESTTWSPSLPFGSKVIAVYLWSVAPGYNCPYAQYPLSPPWFSTIGGITSFTYKPGVLPAGNTFCKFQVTEIATVYPCFLGLGCAGQFYSATGSSSTITMVK